MKRLKDLTPVSQCMVKYGLFFISWICFLVQSVKQSSHHWTRDEIPTLQEKSRAGLVDITGYSLMWIILALLTLSSSTCPFTFPFNFSSRLRTSCHFPQTPDPGVCDLGSVLRQHLSPSGAYSIDRALWSAFDPFALYTLIVRCVPWGQPGLCALSPQRLHVLALGRGPSITTHRPARLGVSCGSSSLQSENDPMCLDKLTVHETPGDPTLKLTTSLDDRMARCGFTFR